MKTVGGEREPKTSITLELIINVKKKGARDIFRAWFGSCE